MTFQAIRSTLRRALDGSGHVSLTVLDSPARELTLALKVLRHWWGVNASLVRGDLMEAHERMSALTSAYAALHNRWWRWRDRGAVP